MCIRDRSTWGNFVQSERADAYWGALLRPSHVLESRIPDEAVLCSRARVHIALFLQRLGLVRGDLRERFDALLVDFADQIVLTDRSEGQLYYTFLTNTERLHDKLAQYLTIIEETDARRKEKDKLKEMFPDIGKELVLNSVAKRDQILGEDEESAVKRVENLELLTDADEAAEGLERALPLLRRFLAEGSTALAQRLFVQAKRQLLLLASSESKLPRLPYFKLELDGAALILDAYHRQQTSDDLLRASAELRDVRALREVLQTHFAALFCGANDASADRRFIIYNLAAINRHTDQPIIIEELHSVLHTWTPRLLDFTLTILERSPSSFRSEIRQLPILLMDPAYSFEDALQTDPRALSRAMYRTAALLASDGDFVASAARVNVAKPN
eukprot:TRINITY_DN7866_c0_g1_i1.p1 TRINITY_DN7866_c0_g1~~TRINITY_DN7866_c0_g1_i1.p1  ORF type:complete len:407 (-),score=117.43 TRINITY_DN7866_c0_g1_i1:1463-2623(-)